MMGGPEMAPQTPQRSGRPGEPGPPLDHSVLIGVDVGGTTIAAGAVTADGQVLHDGNGLTHDAAAAGTLVTIERLVQRVSGALAARGLTVAGIGVGVPGPVDAGVVGAPAPHAADLVGQPLGPRLAAHFGVPVFVDNDVNALALAEWRFGAGRGARSLVVLAPGTGFGAGIILDGRLVRGVAGFGGEFGHTPVKFDGPSCWCGGRGCLAVYASGRGIAEAARARVAGHVESPLVALSGGGGDRVTAEVGLRGPARDDPSGVTTYAVAGAAFGTGMLWTAVVTLPLMAAIQLVCAHIGVVSGRGLAGAMRAHYPRWFLYAACLLLLAANVFNIAADLAGMADAAEMLTGLTSGLWVPVFGLLVLAATIYTSYAAFALWLKWLTAVL